ncbi:type II secretion system protein N [Pacificimonas sp. WHA3]|uniref:Type II secretion system protein N n=1 Tax=Pacificimonas pallii TaxID=2827236 RepID=A0ABS6SHE3_9SPHN|nr:type II secretion system protein N [Pacificimonas pallii]MBV7257819.1 type II secretion system protein N [Pacificimonas pallii]
MSVSLASLMANPGVQRAGVFLLLLALSLTIFAPAGLLISRASEQQPVWVRSVDGTIWSGTAHDLHVGNIAMGNTQFHSGIAGMLTGSPKVVLNSMPGAPLSFRADIADGGNVLDFDVKGDVQALGLPVPFAGTISVTEGRVVMAGNICASASGDVTASIDFPDVGTQPLTGAAECRSGDLVMRLSPAPGSDASDFIVNLTNRTFQ